MRGSGLTDAARAARERLRLQTVEGLAGAQRNAEVASAAGKCAVGGEAARAWFENGEVGLPPEVSPGKPAPGVTQIAGLERELERDPLAHEWGTSDGLGFG